MALNLQVVFLLDMGFFLVAILVDWYSSALIMIYVNTQESLMFYFVIISDYRLVLCIRNPLELFPMNAKCNVLKM